MLTRVSMSAGHLLICNDGMSEQKCLSKRALALHCACAFLDVLGQKKLAWERLRGHCWAETCRNKTIQNLYFSVTTTRREFRSEHDLSIICPRSWVGQVEVDPIESQIKWTRSAQVAEVQSNIPGIATLKCPRFGILPHFAALSQCLKSFLAGVLAYHAKTCSWIKDFPTALTWKMKSA